MPTSRVNMDQDESDVQLYVYDLSMGLAAQLSPMFLGKQLLYQVAISNEPSLHRQEDRWDMVTLYKTIDTCSTITAIACSGTLVL